MALAEKAYEEIKKLPEPLIQEVLDFIEFLEVKQGKSMDIIKAQGKSLSHIWDNEEDEVWNEFKPK